MKLEVLIVVFLLGGLYVVEAAWESLGSGEVTETEGMAEVAFSAAGMVPPGSVLVTHDISEVQSGELLGIRLKLDAGVPSTVMLVVNGAAGSCSKYITECLPDEGDWKTIFVDTNAEGWEGNTEVLESPETLSVFLRQGSTDAESYVLAEVIRAAKPVGEGVFDCSVNGGRALRWSNLRSDVTYRLLKTHDLSAGEWILDCTVTPSESGVLDVVPSDEDAETCYYKLAF